MNAKVAKASSALSILSIFCLAACGLAPLPGEVVGCGNGVVEIFFERCDDGNNDEDDECTTACTLPFCGDGIRSAGESCDDGNNNENDECTAACTLPRCGDGVQSAGESCDDGDENNRNLCSNDCMLYRLSPHFDFVSVASGTHTVGSPEGEPERHGNEEQHAVRLQYSFAISKHEMTQAQYQALMGANPSHFNGNDRPVEQVNWFDAVAAANAASAREGLERCYIINGNMDARYVTWPEGLACNGYRLPTEHEWEVAARAGEQYRYAGSGDVNAVAWHEGNSGEETHPVGQKQPNAWGVYDMSGNVWEWTWDWHDSGYGSGMTTDPIGPHRGSKRSFRGGCWAERARVAVRQGARPSVSDTDLGFRLVRTIP